MESKMFHDCSVLLGVFRATGPLRVVCRPRIPGSLEDIGRNLEMNELLDLAQAMRHLSIDVTRMAGVILQCVAIVENLKLAQDLSLLRCLKEIRRSAPGIVFVTSAPAVLPLKIARNHEIERFTSGAESQRAGQPTIATSDGSRTEAGVATAPRESAICISFGWMIEIPGQPRGSISSIIRVGFGR